MQHYPFTAGPFKLYGEPYQGGLGADDKQKLQLREEEVKLDPSTKDSEGRYASHPAPEYGLCANHALNHILFVRCRHHPPCPCP